MVWLDAGETRSVTLEVAVDDLAWYDPEAGAWTVERMEHELYVGTSSASEDLTQLRFTVR